VKPWPILIISGTQRHGETWRKWQCYLSLDTGERILL